MPFGDAYIGRAQAKEFRVGFVDVGDAGVGVEDGDGVAGGVHRAADPQHLFVRALAFLRHGLLRVVRGGLAFEGANDAGLDFEEVERLVDVVHRAEVERAELVLRAVAAGEDDDGDGFERGIGLEGREHVEAIHVRQAEVEEDQVKLVGPRQRQRPRALGGDGGLDVVGLKGDREQVGHLGAVLDNQNSGCAHDEPGC